jgi:uncharacterized protein (TIGR02453 family)
MIARILDFLRDLAVNNNRVWFAANKELFDELKQAHYGIVQDLIYRLSEFDPELIGLSARDCVFRIQRDIRFSPNKDPYKTHLGAYICAEGGRNSNRSGYYLHLEPGNCLISGGLWHPEAKLLKELRQDIYDHIEDFIDILENPAFRSVYPRVEGEMLKRTPAGFAVDARYEYLFRCKDYCITAPRPDEFFMRKDWAAHAVEYFKLQIPLHRFLNCTVDDYNGRFSIK